MYSPVVMRYPIQITINHIFFIMSRNNNKNNRQTANRSKLTQVAAAKSYNIGSREEIFTLSDKERVISFTPGTTSFVASGFPCNPALPNSFPWLSGHASLYDKYKITKLVYRWVPIKGTTYTGNVILGFDYDALDGVPTSGIQMCALSHFQSGAVWDEFELKIPCDNIMRFTRSGPAAGDIKTYDFGALYVSTEGTTDTTLQGYVECEYTVHFQHKNYNTGTSGNVFTTALFTGDSTIDTITPGNSVRFNQGIVGYTPGGMYNTIDFVDGAGGTSFTLPKGRWLVTAKVNINAAGFVATLQAGGTAVTYNAFTQGTGSGNAVLQFVATSQGTNTVFIINASALSFATTRNYSSICFELLE